jgi:hypothetical protein
MGRARGKEAAKTRTELVIAKSVMADYESIFDEKRRIEGIERDQQIEAEIERDRQIAVHQMSLQQMAHQREEMQQIEEQSEREHQIAVQQMAEQREEMQQIAMHEMAEQRDELLRKGRKLAAEREELMQRGLELAKQQLADSQLAERGQLDHQLAEHEQLDGRLAEQEELDLQHAKHHQLAEQEQLDSRLAEQEQLDSRLAEQEHLESRLAEQHLAEQQHYRAEQDEMWGQTWGQTWGTSWDSSSWSRWPPEDPGPRSEQATSSSSPKVTDQHIGFHSRGIYETTSEPLKYTKDGKIACLKCAGGYSVGCDYECCKAHCPKPLVCERHKMPTQRDIISSEKPRVARAPRRPGPGFRK